jgi:hypothetical protein
MHATVRARLKYLSLEIPAKVSEGLLDYLLQGSPDLRTLKLYSDLCQEHLVFRSLVRALNSGRFKKLHTLEVYNSYASDPETSLRLLLEPIRQGRAPCLTVLRFRFGLHVPINTVAEFFPFIPVIDFLNNFVSQSQRAQLRQTAEGYPGLTLLV